MKLAAQEDRIPGDELSQKLSKMESYGFQGIEFWGQSLPERVDEVKEAIASSTIEPSTICAGYSGCLLDNDEGERKKAMKDIKSLLRIGGEIGVLGLITVPIFGKARLPNLSPLNSSVELEKELLVLELEELGKVAAENNCTILIEPLNRYETHLVKTLQDAVEIQKRVNLESVKIMADFFHMNIEERDIPESIREAGEAIHHVHLADSTRLLPGYGHTDFKSGFEALKEIGFGNYMALECGVPGDPEKELPKSVEYLKSCM